MGTKIMFADGKVLYFIIDLTEEEAINQAVLYRQSLDILQNKSSNKAIDQTDRSED